MSGDEKHQSIEIKITIPPEELRSKGLRRRELLENFAVGVAAGLVLKTPWREPGTVELEGTIAHLSVSAQAGRPTVRVNLADPSDSTGSG